MAMTRVLLHESVALCSPSDLHRSSKACVSPSGSLRDDHGHDRIDRHRRTVK
jgi:hypothetical protein